MTTPGGQDGWGAGAGLSQARWGVASEPGVGARTKPWPREGPRAAVATPRRPGSHSGDDPHHATRPSFPRGLGCVCEVALLALRKSKRLPTPEAFRPPQSLKKFISHHRGGGDRTQSRKPGRHAIRKSPGFDEFALVPYGNKPPPPPTHTLFTLLCKRVFTGSLAPVRCKGADGRTLKRIVSMPERQSLLPGRDPRP